MRQDFWGKTMIGGWLKTFITVILAGILKVLIEKGSILSFDWATLDTILVMALVATLPVVINFLNKKDTRYGLGKNSNI